MRVFCLEALYGIIQSFGTEKRTEYIIDETFFSFAFYDYSSLFIAILVVR